jgi:hypothetical protein
LSYDASTGRYRYSWQTENAWEGACRVLELPLADTTVHEAYVDCRR